MGVVGVIGILLFFAGAHLLWQARTEVLYWLQVFLRILRREVTRRGGLSEVAARLSPAEVPGTVAGASPRNLGTLVMLGGFALMFLGPLLILLDLVL